MIEMKKRERKIDNYKECCDIVRQQEKGNKKYELWYKMNKEREIDLDCGSDLERQREDSELWTNIETKKKR